MVSCLPLRVGPFASHKHYSRPKQFLRAGKTKSPPPRPDERVRCQPMARGPAA